MGTTRHALSKSEKALVALAAISIALWLLETAVPFLLPLRQFSLALVLILGGLLAMRRLMGLGRWAIRRMLWRVRHRMIAVFFFVGALPISIATLLVVLGMLLVLGPLTRYMVTDQFVNYSARMRAAAEPLLWHLLETPSESRQDAVASFHRNATGEFPGLVLLTEFDGQSNSYPNSTLSGKPPSRLLREEALLRKDDDIFLVTGAEDDSTGGLVVLAVPVTGQLMGELMPGLGVLELRIAERDVANPGWGRFAPRPAINPGSPLEQVGIPPPRHPLDWQINWPVQTPVLDWDSDQIVQTPYLLRTRPSALWGRIFAQESEPMMALFVVLGYGLIAAFGASLLVSLFIAASITRTLTHAINDLYVGTRHVNRGEFAYRIPVKGSDQVSDLSRSFNAMTESIQQLIEESKRRLQLEAELEIAREVQSRLFPAQTPSLAGLEVLGVCRPARSVSGDFYDYVTLDEHRLAICFGDVSGKGISAALVMASLHSIMRTQLSLLHRDEREELQAAASVVVGRANVQLCEGTAPEKFSTLFFGAYNSATGVLAYCNAGHLPPLLVRNGDIRSLSINGMVVGAFPFATYEADSVRLQSGDLLVAFTDGVTEPENDAGVEFGEERLMELLRTSPHASAKDLIERVMNDVITWTGKETLQDDMTMLVLRRL